MPISILGIWSRFPYLHNASVPTIYEMLLPAAKRTKVFSLQAAGELERFDSKKLGLTMASNRAAQSYLERQAKSGARWIYDTSRIEHSNQGHEFGFYKDLADPDRYALVEYLKTL